MGKTPYRGARARDGTAAGGTGMAITVATVMAITETPRHRDAETPMMQNLADHTQPEKCTLLLRL